MPQLNLNFHDIPVPEARLWDEFDEEHKRAVIQILIRLFVKATRANHQELTND